jgi:hypothetical protein
MLYPIKLRDHRLRIAKVEKQLLLQVIRHFLSEYFLNPTEIQQKKGLYFIRNFPLHLGLSYRNGTFSSPA